MYRLHCLLIICPAIILGVAVEGAKSQRLDRDNLMLYRGTANDVVPVTNEAEWNLRRTEILAAMQTVMGPLPPPFVTRLKLSTCIVEPPLLTVAGDETLKSIATPVEPEIEKTP